MSLLFVIQLWELASSVSLMLKDLNHVLLAELEVLVVFDVLQLEGLEAVATIGGWLRWAMLAMLALR